MELFFGCDLMILKLIICLMVISVFILLIGTAIIKIFNNFLQIMGYKLSLKFSYIVACLIIFALSVFAGKSILSYLL